MQQTLPPHEGSLVAVHSETYDTVAAKHECLRWVPSTFRAHTHIDIEDPFSISRDRVVGGVTRYKEINKKALKKNLKSLQLTKIESAETPVERKNLL